MPTMSARKSPGKKKNQKSEAVFFILRILHLNVHNKQECLRCFRFNHRGMQRMEGLC